MSLSDIDALSKILSPLLIIAGWYLVVTNQARQSRRKLIRDEVDKLSTLVIELTDSAILFHTEEASDSNRRKILGKLTFLSRRIGLVPKLAKLNWTTWDAVRATQLSVPSKDIIAFRQAITLNHFDDTTDARIGMDSALVAGIEIARDALLASLDSQLIAALD